MSHLMPSPRIGSGIFESHLIISYLRPGIAHIHKKTSGRQIHLLALLNGGLKQELGNTSPTLGGIDRKRVEIEFAGLRLVGDGAVVHVPFLQGSVDEGLAQLVE